MVRASGAQDERRSRIIRPARVQMLSLIARNALLAIAEERARYPIRSLVGQGGRQNQPRKLSVEAAPKPSSTDLIEAAIMRIAHDPLYGGDCKRSDNGGSPDSDPPAA